jgi:hypothetical protein
MSNTLEKLQSYHDRLIHVDEKMQSARLGLDTVFQLIEEDMKAEKEYLKPETPNSGKKPKYANSLNLDEDDGYTWQEFFDVNDQKKLSVGEQCKANEWKTKLIYTYNREFSLLNEDGTKVFPFPTGPIRGIVNINMSHGRSPNTVKYIGMIGFLTHYGGEGQETEYMSNKDFKMCVTKKHIQTLKDWRHGLYAL